MAAPVGCLGGPSVNVAISIDVRLDYLAGGPDVWSVIVAVREAAVSYVNNQTGDLTLAGVSAVAAAVPGVRSVRAVYLNGLADDVAAATFFTLPQHVDLSDTRIVPT